MTKTVAGILIGKGYSIYSVNADATVFEALADNGKQWCGRFACNGK